MFTEANTDRDSTPPPPSGPMPGRLTMEERVRRAELLERATSQRDAHALDKAAWNILARALSAGTARADLQELREAARALLDSLPYHTPECPYCPGRVMATKVATLKHPLAGIRFTCDAHVQDGDEARDLETSAQVRTLRALLEGGSK